MHCEIRVLEFRQREGAGFTNTLASVLVGFANADENGALILKTLGFQRGCFSQANGGTARHQRTREGYPGAGCVRFGFCAVGRTPFFRNRCFVTAFSAKQRANSVAPLATTQLDTHRTLRFCSPQERLEQ
jgi:hypothetical protein